jgi:hypothetical protein
MLPCRNLRFVAARLFLQNTANIVQLASADAASLPLERCTLLDALRPVIAPRCLFGDRLNIDCGGTILHGVISTLVR